MNELLEKLDKVIVEREYFRNLHEEIACQPVETSIIFDRSDYKILESEIESLHEELEDIRLDNSGYEDAHEDLVEENLTLEEYIVYLTETLEDCQEELAEVVDYHTELDEALSKENEIIIKELEEANDELDRLSALYNEIEY